jgi:predicted CoA-binding protein
MNAIQAAERFLELRRFAFVGVSRDPASFSRRVYDAFLERGYDVVPVHPAAAEIDGRRAFPTVADVAPAVEGVFLLVPPDAAARAAHDALARGVRHIWFHRGAGPGSSSPAALAECAAAGITPVTDLCPFMVLPGTGLGHRLHGWFRKRELVRRSA